MGRSERDKDLDDLFRESGPYQATSLADGRIMVTPRWPQFPVYNDDDGGGPGVMSRMALARLIEERLNEDG